MFSLEGWHADPRPREDLRLLEGQGGIARLIARFQLGLPTAADLLALREGACARERALVELVWGQLLMSRRLSGAMEHLARGFDIARPFLSNRAYFALLKRHRLLARLPLFPAPRPAQCLEALLTEARVIERLDPLPPPPGDRRDTWG